MRPRTVEMVAVTGLLLAGTQAYSGCGSLYDELYAPLEAGGGGSGGSGAGAGAGTGAGPTTGLGGCLSASQCDDGNECTIDTCMSAVCAHESDPSHVPAQVAGDCHAIVCAGGSVVEKIDDQDVQIDDDPCTADTCMGGQPTHALVADGGECQDQHGEGFCLSGLCIHGKGGGCSSQVDCDPPNVCIDGVCCENACQGTCVSCNQPGSPGDCEILPGGAEDLEGAGAMLCKEDWACLAGGGCAMLQSNGETCSNASECASGSCAPAAGSPDGVCKLSNGSACAEPSECCSNSCAANKCLAANGALVDPLCDGSPLTN